ncbi:putative regulatory protein TetR [Mycobacteroides abscessus subsp. abscessus]|uniref:TetR/AcrR family transcriptional regulator n=1 Tax=Mycobacteroides abscessus TaxID=36809 RepID=UPI000665D955|nr:TetR/AcrR family transcriptional regulator [Mycobacteroides abscessus]AKP60570.1 TetR family transcriptional regulator [Mycobacteroides abscessus UC22]SHR39571.1 Putative regulatory protein, TetR [Mycobacteroides abscessus subsp. abscessus]SHT37000.1 putative regulatory protein TetR [Mycobacteroides abscessus subsp. abscessus]SHT45842.1 putative regulatory protein TetR [Mycobacteroides abscessus subsp. abscessus]SHT66317.1 putative regulatory protein TetR [Mycobacteroides abscessus subsp. a
MPRISASSVEEHREQVHRRVFQAFADLMSEQSFDAITMAKLATAAGIGRTAIYHHFADKEAVIVEFASHETSRYLEGLRAALSDISDPAQRLSVYIRHQLQAGQQFHMGLGNQLYGTLSRDAAVAIREHVVAVEEVLLEILRDGVAAGTFVVEDRAATISLIHACLAPRHLPIEAIQRFVLRALGATP